MMLAGPHRHCQRQTPSTVLHPSSVFTTNPCFSLCHTPASLLFLGNAMERNVASVWIGTANTCSADYLN